MKSVITIIAGLMIASVGNAKALLVLEKTPGFEMNPTSFTLTLDDSGKIILESHEYRTSKNSVKKVAQLAKSVVKKIEAQLATIDPNAEAVDQQAGESQCTDTPTVEVNNLVSGKVQNIYRTSGCHTWTLPYDEGLQAAQFLLFLAWNSN